MLTKNVSKIQRHDPPYEKFTKEKRHYVFLDFMQACMKGDVWGTFREPGFGLDEL